MQSKTNTFFKSPAHVPKSIDPVLAATDGNEDELAIWEKKEHHIFNTYEQRNLDPKIYSICGVKFAPGDAKDEKAHKKFHRTYTEGLPFKGWINERIVHMLNSNGDRIILVLQTDPPAQKKKVEEVVKMMEIDLGTEWIIHGHCKEKFLHGFRDRAFSVSILSANNGRNGVSIKLQWHWIILGV